MGKTDTNNNKKHITLRRILLRIELSVFIPLITVIIIIEHNFNRTTLVSEYRTHQRQTEANIEKAIRITNEGYKALDASLKSIMLDSLNVFLREYEKNNGEIMSIDLQGLKEILPYDMDLYILSPQAKVLLSTYTKDIGQDLSQYEHFYSVFKRKIKTGKPWTDQITMEVATGKLRKYSYMPTPDGKYVLELGLETEEFSQHLFNLDADKVTAQIKQFNPALESVYMYDDLGKRWDKPGYITSGITLDSINEAVSSGRIYERKTGRNRIVRYMYVDMTEPDEGTNPSRIVELTYSTAELKRKLWAITSTQILLGFAAILIILFVTSYTSRLITNPIHKIVNDIKQIDSGNLDKEIQIQTNNELSILVTSINNLVARLKKSIEKNEESLEKAEKMAFLGNMISSVAHDINTPVGIGITAASNLKVSTRKVNDKFHGGTITKTDFQDFLVLADESSKMIGFNLERASSLIRSFKRIAVDQGSEEAYEFNLKELVDDIRYSLHPVIRKTKHEITITCEADLIVRTYPGAFSQVITNLVMNSVIHGFQNDEAGKIETLMYVDQEHLVISHCDNGKGIPEKEKDKVFQPYYTTKRGKGGSGLGMHIIKQTVENTLHGSVVLASSPEGGVRFTFDIPLKHLHVKDT